MSTKVQIIIKELALDGDTAIKIANCLKEHEPEIWQVIEKEINESVNL